MGRCQGAKYNRDRHHRMSVGPCPRSTFSGNADITDLDIARYFETLDTSVRHDRYWMVPERKKKQMWRLLGFLFGRRPSELELEGVTST
jgi:hypothetical protein